MKTTRSCKSWTKSGQYWEITCHCIGIALALLAAAGCSPPIIEEDAEIRALRVDLDTIETVQPANLSDVPPVSIEKASKEITEQISDANDSTSVVELMIEQVRAATLANNLDLKIDLIDPAIAQQTVDMERAKFEATFFGSAAYGVSETETGISSTSNDYEARVEVPLQTGGSVAVGLPLGESDSEGVAGVADAAVSVSFIQSLLKGRGTRINTNSIRIADYQKHAIDARTKQNVIDLLAEADIAYWLLYTACRELDVRRQQYKLAQNQLDHARLKVASGASAKIEIVRSEAGLSRRIEAVINAETMVQNRQLDLQRIMNRQDMPLNASVRVIPKTEPNPLGLDINEEKLVEIALDSRMETIQLELQLAIDKLNVEVARNAILPDLSFTYSYTAQVHAGDVGHALGDLGDNTSDTHFVGIYATIPIGNEVAKARLKEARLRQIQRRASQARLRQFIQQEVYDTARALNNSWRRILAADKAVETAHRDYEVEQSQFHLGQRTSTDVLNSATGFASAQLSRIRAFAEYEISQIRLARATGTLLGYSKIMLEPKGLQELRSYEATQ
jgi:outer membrane protein